jgi:hypothetical protein
MCFLPFFKIPVMKKNEIRRNEPAVRGKDNDPDLRDDAAIQPGVSTVSSGDHDRENEELTKTAADDFRTNDDRDPDADPVFDEVDKK